MYLKELELVSKLSVIKSGLETAYAQNDCACSGLAANEKKKVSAVEESQKMETRMRVMVLLLHLAHKRRFMGCSTDSVAEHLSSIQEALSSSRKPPIYKYIINYI